MKKILVPCDFSYEASQAYKFALDLAALADLEVSVVHAIDLPVVVAGFDIMPYTYDPSLKTELSEFAYKNFNAMKETHGGSSSVQFNIVFDSIWGAIRNSVEAGDIELVLMGTKGSSGVEEFLFGSNTEKVVRLSSVPVIAIRKAPPAASIKKIVFPNRLTLDQSELLNRVTDLQQFFKAHIYLLWVNTPAHFLPDPEIKGMMREFVNHYKLTDYSLEVRNDINEESGIQNFAHEMKMDMVAMGTSGRRGIAHLMAGSIAEDVVNHVKCPIWTFSTRK